jgi:hypothetical protein
MQHPTHMAPPKPFVGIMLISVLVRVLMVMTVQTNPPSGAALHR